MSLLHLLLTNSAAVSIGVRYALAPWALPAIGTPQFLKVGTQFEFQFRKLALSTYIPGTNEYDTSSSQQQQS